MSASELLRFVESRYAARQDAERDILRAAYQWAVLHSPDALPPGDTKGRERARPAGAEGTLLITEYASAAFGARIKTSPYGAKKLIADAVDLAHRLPRLHAGIEAGTVAVRQARHVAEATRELTEAQAAWVDAEVAEVADGRLPWTRFEALIEGKVAAAAPDRAREKEEAAALDRSVRISRVNKHGIATLTIRDNVAAIRGADAAITAVAMTLAEQMPDANIVERRLAAFAALVNPKAHLDPAIGPVKPQVTIYLHLTPDSPIARMEGHGPVTTAWIRHLTTHLTSRPARSKAEHASGRVQIQPVIDLAGQAPVDAYEIPARLRQAVHLLLPADVFPYAANTGRKVDLDHTQPYSNGGPTAIGNLAPLTRTHHRIKTHGGWQARQPFHGIVIWRDPHGAHYLIDATGTRKTTASA